MKTSAEFWDGVAEKYAKDPIKNMDAYERTLERVRSYLRAEDRVLEIGCGTGMTALKLVPSVSHILATDVSEAMVEIGRKRAAEAGEDRVEFAAGTAFDGPHIGQTYDSVLSFNFLHLADDPQATIAACFDRVKPGGFFISKSACMMDWTWYMKALIKPMIWGMQKIGKAPHLSYFTRAELDQMMRNAGFELVETHDFSMSPPSHFIVARRP